MKFFYLILVLLTTVSCKNKSVEQQEDQIYSRHLQRTVKLTIINTPVPSNKSELNLLLLNDGQDIKSMRVKEITDSLFKLEKIGPLVIVAVHAGDRLQEYGVSGRPDYEKRGSKADNYNSFVDKELFAFIKKKAAVKTFNTVAIGGWSLGGLSAFDIAWNNTDKIDKVGAFSGSFWWRDKNISDSAYSDSKNRIVLTIVKAARRKQTQPLWLYAGAQEETSDRDKDGTIDVIDDMQDLNNELINKGLLTKTQSTVVIDPTGKHSIEHWSKHLPEFLIWAFGK